MAKFSPIAHAAAAGDDDLGGGQFRTVRLGQLFGDEFGLGRPARGVEVSTDGRAAIAGLFKRRRAHGDDFLGVGGFHRHHGVARIDRTHEGVGAFTAVMSEICITSSLAATRGHEVLAHGGGGARMAS
jgi:hypothetical protein